MSAATIFGSPLYTAWDVITGLPLSGGLVTTYAAGSSTPIATWTDYTRTVANNNPIQLSASGTAVIYLIPGVEYKFIVTDQFGTPQYAQDYIEGIPSLSSFTVNSGIQDFRLTLTQGVPLTAADVTAAITVYCSPYIGRQITLFDSTGAGSVYSSAEFSIAVPSSTSQMYDVFCYANGTVPTLELLAWTNDTARATALTLATTGCLTKSGDLTRRYLGSFRTTAVSGQTEDSGLKRYLWNYYSRDRRPLMRLETTSSWTYTTAAFHQANAAAANQVDLVIGVAEATLDLSVTGMATNGTGSVLIYLGIGEDSTSSSLAIQGAGGATLGASPQSSVSLFGHITKKPAVGRHFYSWLEYSGASGTTTWYGTNGAPNNIGNGLMGWIEG